MKTFEEIKTAEYTEMTKDTYLDIETRLAKQLKNYIVGSKVSCITYGDGTVTDMSETVFEDIIITITFTTEIKRYSLLHIMTASKPFIQFSEIAEITEFWNSAYEAHKVITATYKECLEIAKQKEREALIKAEADRKAEEKYQRQKESALKAFETLVSKDFISSSDNNFYYALGWLVKHTNSISAALPDYLADAFAKYFGTEAPCRVVDSKHRGPAGWQSQWSWSFKMSLKKTDTVPEILHKHLNPKQTAISDTAFVWDLIDNYGFQFGKEQDLDKIAKTIPAKYIESFNAGLTA